MAEQPPGSHPNHWERWRGEVNAKLAELTERSKGHDEQCRACRKNVDSHFSDLYTQLHSEVATLNAKVAKIEVRIAWIAGAAALAGSGLHGIVEWVMAVAGK